MLDSLDILRLYENVLKNDSERYNISLEAIQFGIECMAHVYGETTVLYAKRSTIADFRDPAHRCAYLFKYAALHTAMVHDMLKEAVKENFNFFQKLICSGEQFKLCSLGGGPGTDVIGSLATLHAAFGDFKTSVTVVDYMHEWRSSFDSILKELGNGQYGAFGNNISNYLHWQYIRANLLSTFKSEVLEALSSASLVTMVKFISAAACMDTRSMIRNIFSKMKPGAALLYIDNDGGGFNNLIADAAVEFGFISKFGPLRKQNYLKNIFKKRRFGYLSCCQTTVTVHLLQKPVKTSPAYDFSSISTKSHELRYRQVIIDDNFASKNQSLVSSPISSMYLGRPNENSNNFTLSRPSLIISISPAASTLQYSEIEVCHEEKSDENQICAPAHDVEEIPHSSRRNVIFSPCTDAPKTSKIKNLRNKVSLFRNVNYTPDTQPRGKRARRSCFPLRIKRFKRHLSNKFDQIKALAPSYPRKKKKKKNHPNFKF